MRMWMKDQPSTKPLRWTARHCVNLTVRQVPFNHHPCLTQKQCRRCLQWQACALQWCCSFAVCWFLASMARQLILTTAHVTKFPLEREPLAWGSLLAVWDLSFPSLQRSCGCFLLLNHPWAKEVPSLQTRLFWPLEVREKKEQSWTICWYFFIFVTRVVVLM